MHLPRLIACVLVITGCSDGPSGPPRPGFAEVRQVVIVGDGAATGPLYASSFARLIATNDNTRFPEFAGHDMDARGLAVSDVSRGGDSYHAIASLAEPICRCNTTCAETAGCALVEGTDPALVVVALGTNDILDFAIRMVLDSAIKMDSKPAVAEFRANVRAVFDGIDAMFEVRPMLVVVTPYDPTDGTGDFAAVAVELFPMLDPGIISAEDMKPILEAIQRVIREEAEAVNARIVDGHGHFRGHGYHHADEALPQHDADDPTRWLQHVLDPSARGAHELRRIVWNAVTGESITGLPGALSPPDGEALPDVPAIGWADSVVDSSITQMIVDDEAAEWPNVAADPIKALGAPDGDEVAIGVTGAWVEVELAEAAFDGPGPDLVVVERGARASGAPETYRVWVASVHGPWTVLADGRGERAFDLAGTGFESVRHIRIASNANLLDITNGFGSPLFPGPEIDAVGAVHVAP